jgi:hypothetical protein
MYRSLFAVLLALPALGQGSAWRLADLPKGFRLDLVTGEVVDSGASHGLRWRDGRLECTGLRVSSAMDVLIEGLTVENETGSALVLGTGCS